MDNEVIFPGFLHYVELYLGQEKRGQFDPFSAYFEDPKNPNMTKRVNPRLCDVCLKMAYAQAAGKLVVPDKRSISITTTIRAIIIQMIKREKAFDYKFDVTISEKNVRTIADLVLYLNNEPYAVLLIDDKAGKKSGRASSALVWCMDQLKVRRGARIIFDNWDLDEVLYTSDITAKERATYVTHLAYIATLIKQKKQPGKCEDCSGICAEYKED